MEYLSKAEVDTRISELEIGIATESHPMYKKLTELGYTMNEITELLGFGEEDTFNC